MAGEHILERKEYAPTTLEKKGVGKEKEEEEEEMAMGKSAHYVGKQESRHQGADASRQVGRLVSRTP